MSGIFDFGASLVQAEGIKQQAESQARAAEFNAEQAQEKAGIQRTQTKADVERAGREARSRAGSSRAAAGALGGIGDFGDVLESNAIQDELDILTIKQRGAVAEKDLLTGARLNIMEAQSSRQAGKIGSAAAILRGTGSLIKTGEQAAMAAAGGSDYRLKEDIKHIGYKDNHKIYTFKYKGGDITYKGVMAQDLLDKNPELVRVMSNGYLAVDYKSLGFDMEAICHK